MQQRTIKRTNNPLVTTTGDSKPRTPLAETTAHNFSTDSEPVTIISSSSEVDYISEVSLGKGRIQLHSELIEALRNLATKLESRYDGGRTVMNKERVLEQAIVEQSQILDLMQGLISSLETENKSFRDKIDVQGRIILELASWEAKAKKAERQISELTVNIEPSMNVSNYKKSLAEKDKLISDLRSQSSVSVNTRLAAVQTNLERERVGKIELEQELSSKREELIKLKEELSSRQSVLISKESEVLHLRHEMKSAKKFEYQQQELALQQRTALVAKDSQLTALTRALSEEKKLCQQLRKKQFLDSRNNSKVGDSNRFTDDPSTACLFEQVLGRDIVAVEITKLSEDTDVGFSYSKIELPISSRLSCLVVKAVKQGGNIALGKIKAGDEILEVNGISCRGPHQENATGVLQKGKGRIQIVIARDHAPAKPKHEGDGETRWATALPGEDEAMYERFTATVSAIANSETESIEYVSVPTSHHTLPTTDHSETTTSSPRQPEASAYESLQLEITDLQDQLDKSEHACLELENELDEYRSEMESAQMQSDLVKAENFELQQQVSTYAEEVAQIQNNIVDLQSLLVTLQNQVTDEQQRTASYENLNKLLTRELEETKEKCEVARSEANSSQQELEKIKTASSEKELSELKCFAELKQLKSESTRLKSDITTKETKLDELTSILVKKTSEYEQSLSHVKSTLVQVEGELSEVKTVSHQSAASVKCDHEKTLSQLQTAKNSLIEAERKESEMRIQLRYLEQAADAANKQLAESEAKKRAIENELNSYKGEVESISLNSKSLSLGLRHTQTKLEAKEHTLSRLQTEVDDLRRNSAKLSNEMSRLKTENKRLESSLKSTESEQVRQEQKLRSSNSEKDSLFQDLENAIDESTQLQQKVDDMEKLNKEMQSTDALKIELEVASSKENTRDLDNSKKKVEVLKQQLSQLKEACVSLERSLEASQRELSNSRAECDSLMVAKEEIEKRASELQGTINVLTVKLDQSEQSSSELKLTCSKLEEEAKIEKEDSTRMKSSLQDEVSSLRRAKKQSEDMTASMEFMLKQQQSKLNDTQSDLKNRREDIVNLKEELESLTNQLIVKTSEKEASEEKLNVITQKLDESKREMSELQEQVNTLTLDVSKLKEELQKAVVSSNEYQTLSSQLQTTLNEVNKEREDVQKRLNGSLRKCQEVDKLNERLDGQVSILKAAIAEQERASNSLSSEAARLRKQLRVSEREADKLSAQVQAADINLEVANKTLETERKQFTEYREAAEYVQQLCKETQDKLDDAMVKIQRTSLELHSCKEEKAKLKVNLDLRQKECTLLQQSLVEAQAAVNTLKTKIDTLQSQNSDLSQTLDQLQECQTEIQSSVAASEKEHTECLRAENERVCRLSEEIGELKRNETSRLDKIRILERSLEEARSNVNQLLAAQEALKNSLSVLGDEKEVEILRLTSEIADHKMKNSDVLKQLDVAKKSNSSLETSLKESEETDKQTLAELVKENDTLTQEVNVLKSTEAALSDLHSKIDALENNLRTKTSMLADVSQQVGDLELKLKTADEAINEHQSNLSELAKVKLELVENSIELEHLKKQFGEETKIRTELETERDRLLTVLRKSEVERHTAVVQPPTPQLPRAESGKEIDVNKLVQLLKDKEEESLRLGEYVSKLLSNVVEKAPFVLENFS